MARMGSTAMQALPPDIGRSLRRLYIPGKVDTHSNITSQLYQLPSDGGFAYRYGAAGRSEQISGEMTPDQNTVARSLVRLIADSVRFWNDVME